MFGGTSQRHRTSCCSYFCSDQLGINKVAVLQQGTDPKDLFGFKINYNTIDGDATATNKLYNGNIAETSWSTSPVVRTYGYKYDNLNRLKDGTYQKAGLTTHGFDENLTYDKNGNITSLKRKGNGDPEIGAMRIDDLTYAYKSTSSNQLLKVTDSPNGNDAQGFIDANKTDDYTYDANGNLITDKNKNITAIVYNHLNLPTKITFGTTGNIVYIYNANGQKLEKLVTIGVSPVVKTQYLGGFQYKDNVLQFFPTAEGYVKNTNGIYSYVFNYTDHLGNVRLSYSDTSKNGLIEITEIVDESHYYPFGLKHSGYVTAVPDPNYKYKYNGKELQDELGLNVYDYQNRTYDPATGRWLQMDPLAEKGRRWSPYTYAMDNPIYFIDPDGMWPDNPFSSLISQAKSAVVNYVANKVSQVVSAAKSYVHQKSKEILNAITPSISNPFTTAKADKPDRTSANGVELTTPGGKTGAMATPVTTGNTTKVDVEVVVGLTDVWGPETTVPGVAPDGSNPFQTSAGSETSNSTMSTATSSEDAKVETNNTSVPKDVNTSGYKIKNTYASGATDIDKNSKKGNAKEIKKDSLNNAKSNLDPVKTEVIRQ